MAVVVLLVLILAAILCPQAVRAFLLLIVLTLIALVIYAGSH